MTVTLGPKSIPETGTSIVLLTKKSFLKEKRSRNLHLYDFIGTFVNATSGPEVTLKINVHVQLFFSLEPWDWQCLQETRCV